MDALPADMPADGIETFTGVVCPDCRGSVTVRIHKTHAVFTCRVGHSYSADELIGGKEGALEVRLWEAVYALEELAVLLTDLDRRHLANGADPVESPQRIAQAREQAARLRAIIQADRPVAPAPPGGAGGPAVS
jgi:two-component system, chemotaxis family, protein-glutamate methylesterase/glutaminase